METHEVVPKRGPSSPKIIVDTNLTVQNSSAIRPTPVKPGKSITHLDSNKVQVSLISYQKFVWVDDGISGKSIKVVLLLDRFSIQIQSFLKE